MQQPIEDIEKEYLKPDPWGYKQSAEDSRRKKIILNIARMCSTGHTYPFAYKRAIDICCGEGFITEDLPAQEIFGLEISDNAAVRMHPTIKRVLQVREKDEKFDLIVATGWMYLHYDIYSIFQNIVWATKPGSIIIISNIESWEQQELLKEFFKRWTQIFEARFPYNEHHQKLRVFRVD
jgi:2-polyprenyl-3-methyl-5-hydroxy-6-metoxy-1,4-benzoquinol methylase